MASSEENTGKYVDIMHNVFLSLFGFSRLQGKRKNLI